MSFLHAQGLSKSYDKIPALRELSLDVSEGEIFALVGPDGAGKTSCIRILCGLLSPDAGEAVIGGFSVLREFERIKPLLGYMPQVFSLYPDLSVGENLTFYAGIYGLTGSGYRAKRDALYDFSKLGPFAERRAAALSGGMKQKLALSCALIHDPKVLILDEPTTGVDPLSRRQFWEILLELRQRGTTILVSTPYMDEVAHADRACFIFNGQKLSQGTPDELAAQFEGTIYFLDRTPTTELVERLTSIPGIQARRFGAGMHIYLKPGDQIERYNEPLTAVGIETGQLLRISPELEDRFIQLMEAPS